VGRALTFSAFTTAGCRATHLRPAPDIPRPLPSRQPPSVPATGSGRSPDRPGCWYPRKTRAGHQPVPARLVGLLRYGNSDHSFDKISHYATTASRGSSASATNRPDMGGSHRLPVAEPARADQLNGPSSRHDHRPCDRDAECPPVKNVGEPCAGKSHARFDVGGGGNRPVGYAVRPRRLPPTLPPPRDWSHDTWSPKLKRASTTV